MLPKFQLLEGIRICKRNVFLPVYLYNKVSCSYPGSFTLLDKGLIFCDKSIPMELSRTTHMVGGPQWPAVGYFIGREEEVEVMLYLRKALNI